MKEQRDYKTEQERCKQQIKDLLDCDNYNLSLLEVIKQILIKN